MTLTYQEHSPRGEGLGLGIMKHTKSERQESSRKSVSVPVNNTQPINSLVSTKVKNIEQESKINKLTKLVHMLMDEKINSKTHEQKPESSNSESSSKIMEAIRFTNNSVNEIGIDDSSRDPPDEFLHEDDPSRQYQSNFEILYYVIPHGRSLTDLTQEKHVPEVIAPIEQNIPHTEDVQSPPDLTNTKGTQEQG
ncbi:hypothetical protein Tco_1353155 [Tanacetum coccineum]